VASPQAPGLKVLRLRAAAQIPQRATNGSSGLDLVACLEDPPWKDLSPDPVLIPTGLALEIPFGHDVTIRPRSGLSLRGIGVLLGTIDADYRGELLVSMHTFGSLATYRIHHGDRIAQLVICQLADLPVLEVSELSPSARDRGGHGSTGLR